MKDTGSKHLSVLDRRLSKIERRLSKVQKNLEANDNRLSSISKDLQKLTLGFSTTWLYGLGLAWILAGIGLLVASVPTWALILVFLSGFLIMMMAAYLRWFHR